MQINAPATHYDILDRVIEAAAGLGYPAPTDYNGHAQTGFSYFAYPETGQAAFNYQAFLQ